MSTTITTPRPAEEWVFLHSDAYHPGTRDECDHCQHMIRTYGAMPPAAEIIAAERRMIRSAPKPTIPEAVRWSVWERDDFTCRACGTRRELTVDHIRPRARGGSDDPANLQTLCRRCNSRKGARA